MLATRGGVAPSAGFVSLTGLALPSLEIMEDPGVWRRLARLRSKHQLVAEVAGRLGR